MSIGYACLTIGVPHTNQKSCIQKNASEEKLMEIISHNLNALENIIDYNIHHNIRLFRISSDIIPFGSSPVNTLRWWVVFSTRLKMIGEKINRNGIRVSMHPGQYTVLNSPDGEVVKRGIKDIEYHTLFLDSLGVGPAHKIILHIGGVYQDKTRAIERFTQRYQNLEPSAKKRLVFENDDKSYNIEEVLKIGVELGAPVVFDNLHHAINPPEEPMSELFWIKRCSNTWKDVDGKQKIHYSQQNHLKRAGSHSTSIRINEFMEFYDKVNRDDLDIMLEVKDKNLSAVKCINCTTPDNNMKTLAAEWGRYQYKILENSQEAYRKIIGLLANKDEYPAMEFYTLIEESLCAKPTIGGVMNGAQQVWGYLNEVATEKEKTIFLNQLEGFQQGKVLIKTIKNFLWRMTEKYEIGVLKESFYFIL